MRIYLGIVTLAGLLLGGCKTLDAVRATEPTNFGQELSEMGERVDGSIHLKRGNLRQSDRAEIGGDENDLFLQGRVAADLLGLSSVRVLGNPIRKISWAGSAKIGNRWSFVKVSGLMSKTTNNELSVISGISCDTSNSIKMGLFDIDIMTATPTLPFRLCDASIEGVKATIVFTVGLQYKGESSRLYFTTLDLILMPDQKIQFIGADGELLAELQGDSYSVAAALGPEVIAAFREAIVNIRAVIDMCAQMYDSR